MALQWNELGRAPSLDVPEISVFGPGYGENIVVHVGNGEWIIVDSCVEPNSAFVAPITYLHHIGVDAGNAVQFVVASHWHDDHVRGLSEVVKACRNAVFVSPKVLTSKEFHRYVARFALGNTSSAGSGAGEFQRVHALLYQRLAKPQRKWASADRRLHRFPAVGGLSGCDMWSLSPSDEEYDRFLAFIQSTMPDPGGTRPKRRAATQGPNDASVVIGLDWGAASALLGSDLETFPGVTRGWGAIVSSSGRPEGKSGYLKIPHHGAYSAHHERMWRDMLFPDPTSVLTPFARGGGLPSPHDRERIIGLTKRAYTTARLHPRPTSQVVSDRAVEKMLIQAKITLRQSPELGLVRARFVGSEWQIELFNHAQPLSTAA